MKVVAIIQARMGSVRLPGKVLREIGPGISVIEAVLARLSKSVSVNEIVVATSVNENNIPLANKVEELGYKCHLGSEMDVLDRYYQASLESDADVIVRITGDCPLIDPDLVDFHIEKFFETAVDYCSNTIVPTYPDGLDVEVFSFEVLQKANLAAKDFSDREHVTPYIKRSKSFTKYSVQSDKDLSGLRWTVDEPEDLNVLKRYFEHFYPSILFGWMEALSFSKSEPLLGQQNAAYRRNEGSYMSTGQKLWSRAKRVIPGGNMLLSKRPEMYLPGRWPTYFSKASGCEVIDLDGHMFVDMSVMGVGTSILGYSHPEVDDAVRRAVGDGNMSTLNCPEEVELAEKLVELHPWASMVRLARSGGEANAIAIRIARAASGKDNVAVCGYHGWHDWYLSANLANEQHLDGHLLPGLAPNGVPRALAGTVFPFEYNDFAALEQLVCDHDIGVIKMEVARNTAPDIGFLKKVRALATENSIVLVFDECTSGFREALGGLHLKCGVHPDIAMFGKALGNGYAITAIVGKREVMEVAQSTFISSTFWTERIGPAAALKTLEVMEAIQSWSTITESGNLIRTSWMDIADANKLQLKIWGIPALSGFTVVSKNALEIKTFISQEMLKKGYLAANAIYLSVAHTPEIIDGYLVALSEVFSKISEYEADGSIGARLEGPVCHSGFKRLN